MVLSAISIQAMAAPPGGSAPSTSTCPWVTSHAPDRVRAAQVLSRMTLDEKITMVHGTSGSSYTGYVPGIDRLCIPPLTLQDGPTGVRMANTTQLPSAVSLASTWDTNLATTYGKVIGTEMATKGADVDLGPTVNIVRDPRWGRAFESYSEDPHLTAQIGTGDIKGIQSTGTQAQVKHWAVYNQETNRNTTSDKVGIDERTMREMYTSAFEQIFRESKPSSVMCSYSSPNGTYACENKNLLTGILRKDMNYPGYVTSDWGGTHSTAASANAGLDMEMPGSTYYGGALKQAVQSGTVPQSQLDAMVSRILTQEFRFGMFNRSSHGDPNANASTSQHVATAREVAEAGTVLLKNSNGVLPLTGSTKSIAVIGEGAGSKTMSAGGGSAAVSGTGTVTPVDGITARAKKAGVDVTYAPGPSTDDALPAIGSQYLRPASDDSENGLDAQYYANPTLSGDPTVTRIDPDVDFTFHGTPAAGLPPSKYSARWTGSLVAPKTGSYTISLTSDDGSRLISGGRTLIDNWGDHASRTRTATVSLTEGQKLPITIEYYDNGGSANVNLGWSIPGSDPVGDAVEAAKKADVAVVYANLSTTEGEDLPTIDLPAAQNDLITKVAAANPRTVVVLNTGSAVTMPWLPKVAGVLEAWYPGQETGNAIAGILFGDTNPSGKLPVTFPKSLADVPASTTGQWPGSDGTVQYSEGLKVGYRWYDSTGTEPLFPFGYGLSYTSFKVSGLRLSGSTLTERGRIHARARVTNTGRRAGSEVVQLYLSYPKAASEPGKVLKGFQKVALRAGQTKTVDFRIDAADASYWNTDAHQWALAPGRYGVAVGTSSADVPLTSSFRVTSTTGPRYVSAPSATPVTAGSVATVSSTFTNGSTTPARNIRLALNLPKGWHAGPASAPRFGIVPAGKSVTATWKVTVPKSAEPGSATVTSVASYAGGRAQREGTVPVAYPSVGAAYSTIGVTDEAHQTAGSLDGSGYSYSAEALASVGVKPGAVLPGQKSLAWPAIVANQKNVVDAAGQVIAVKGSGSALKVVGTGTNGAQSGPVTITYADGTTSKATLTVGDWFTNTAGDGWSLVATAPYWNRPTGSSYPRDHKVSLYAASLPVDQGKQVAYVTLPTNSRLHVFTMGVE